MTSMGFFSSDSATRPSSQDCELCGKLGLHLPGKAQEGPTPGWPGGHASCLALEQR